MSIPRSITLIAQEKLNALQSLQTNKCNMKTYEKLVRSIELNDDGPQSCLNTTFTQDHKRKILIGPHEALTWKLKHTSLSK
jgi:hypothetical protein